VPHTKEELRNLALFLFVGAAAAGVYFGLLALFLEVIHLDYRISVSAAYLLAVTFHFLSNRYITFRASGNEITPQVVRYLVVVGVNYVLTLAIVFVVVEILRSSAYIGVALSVTVTVIFSYAASRAWIFRRKEQNHG
jgi:putative flippase GtrA